MDTSLHIWIEQTGAKARTVARAVGLSDAEFSKIRRGRRLPTLEQAFAIERATDGAVPAASWIETAPLGADGRLADAEGRAA